MKILNVTEAKATLSAVLAEVAEKGEKYVICRNGKPVADLVPHVRKSRLSRTRSCGESASSTIRRNP